MRDDASLRPASRTLGDLVDEMAAATPGAEALVFRDERLDYAGLKVRVDEFARALLAVGIGRGDRVALLATNRTEWIVAAFAAAKIGAVVAAVSTFSTPRELAWALEHSGAAALITLDAFRGRHFLDALRGLCPELDRSAPAALRSARLPSLHTVVGVKGRAPAAVFSLPQFLARGAAVNAAALAAAQQAVTPRGYLLHPLYLGLDRGAKGRDACAWAAHRQRLRHRRTAAPSRQRPVMARRAAVLVIRLGQCCAGDHNSWWLHRIAGELRGGRSFGADRARALQRLLRDG